MNMIKKSLLLFLICIGAIMKSFSLGKDFDYKLNQEKNQIIVNHGDRHTKIEVMNDNIIHIVKRKNDAKENTIPNYVAILETQDTKYKVTEKKGVLQVKTANITLKMNQEGVIQFVDNKEKQLLKETASEAPHLKKYAVSQSFECGNEALYGLGQYQSGTMNWKNVAVRLQQYNQEIAIPFLVSTNQYGIYWHNYSITDFNYPADELSFSNTIDEKNNIREVKFKPKESGVYSFFVDEINQHSINRMRGHIKVSIDEDVIINYTTPWIPDNFNGKKYLEAGKTYTILFQNSASPYKGKLRYLKPSFNKSTFSSRHGHEVNYYFVYGETPEHVIAHYQELTGKAPMFEKSVFGFWQCRERYNNQNELLNFANEYRKRKIPVDNIVQDWFYWPKNTKGPQWDRAKYPNPKAMVDELKTLNLNLMVSVWPYVKNNALYKQYHFDGKTLGNPNLDFYNEEVGKSFYQMLSDSMFHIGVDYIWLDGTEPETKPKDKAKTYVGNFEEVTNIYSLVVNKAVYEGKQKEYPNERIFNLTRSAFAGQQRFGAASWSGDISGTWEQFSEQIPAGLNFMMAGIPYWTTDIGGFFRDRRSLNPVYKDQYSNPEYIELLTRWFQFGAFNPLFRIHGYKSNTEIWNYDEAFESTAKKYINLRYQLLPYIYSEARKVSSKGKLLMSPLAYHHPQDKNTWEIKDQFYFGESFLVNPIVEYKARERQVYLPEGIWYHYWTNALYQGEKKISIQAPLDEVPLFVKAGAIIPWGEKIQYANQETKEPLTIKVYAGNNGTFNLYLDDSKTNDYKKGVYTEIKFSYFNKNRSLKIETLKDQYTKLKEYPQTFIIQLIGDNEKQASKSIVFNGTNIEVKF